MTYELDDTQRKWARVIGAAYIIAMILGVFAEFYVGDRVFVAHSAVETARNIVAHERLFRIGTAANLIGMCIDVLLITGLYVVLNRVNRPLALCAICFRMLETGFLMLAALTDFNVLRLLGGAEYLSTISSVQLASLARLSISNHTDAYNVALMLFGFGSSIFCWLWLKSHYIAKALSIWGILASMMIGASAFLLMIFPELKQVLTVYIYATPIFFFELTMGLLLSIKGLTPAREAL